MLIKTEKQKWEEIINFLGEGVIIIDESNLEIVYLNNYIKETFGFNGKMPTFGELNENFESLASNYLELI